MHTSGGAGRRVGSRRVRRGHAFGDAFQRGEHLVVLRAHGRGDPLHQPGLVVVCAQRPDVSTHKTATRAHTSNGQPAGGLTRLAESIYVASGAPGREVVRWRLLTL